MSNDDRTDNITVLREALFAQLRELRAATEPAAVRLAIEKSRAVSEIGKTLIDSARVEIDYLKHNGGGEAPFLEAIADGNLPPGIVGIRQHRLK